MYYIAYGSNINLEQMAFRCPHSKVIGTSVLTGWKLYFDYHANIEHTKNKNDETPILLWDIAAEDWKRLDMYEGFPKYYIKKNIETEFNGEKIKAVVYLMNKKKHIKAPSMDYLTCIYAGYRDNNINTKPLLKAYVESLDY